LRGEGVFSEAARCPPRQMLLMNRLVRDNKQYKVLVSIASPYEGASIAALANTLGVTKGFVEGLGPESMYLFNLRENWNALKDKPKLPANPS
jgi:hypothetical protein